MQNLSIKNASIQTYIPPSFADRERLARMQELFPKIDAQYREFAEKNHFPGYAYGIVMDGKLVHAGSGGYCDIDKKNPATPQSIFRIASMTKSFTAMAILKLRDEGHLKLDDPVYLYVPEIENQQLTDDTAPITVRDLLTHSAGFPTDDPWADRKLAETNAGLLAIVKKGIFFSNASGTTFEYSNFGYALLGSIIEKVTGISYGKYIAETIWEPIGIKQAAWEFTEVPPPQLVQGYRWLEEKWEKEEFLGDGIFGAMGGMLASVESFSQYVALHLSAWPPRNDVETGPIKRSSIREMHQLSRFYDVHNFKYLDGRECTLTRGYGYGLNWARDCQGKVYVGHSGGLPGFGSNWRIMPDYGIGVILLANVTYAPADQMNFNVLDTLVKGAQLKPKQLQSSEMLKDKQKALLRLLPEWKNAEASGIFAENFFLDNPIALLKKQIQGLFVKMGKVVVVGDLIPENQLSGHFTLEGEHLNLHISLGLNPANPPLIQWVQIKESKALML